MRVTLIMMLDHRESVQAWIMLANSKGWRDGGRKEV
jgi:hypothetical protein